ncbi:MAG: restriction endonuclease subunit S [Prevotella sp.]|nr:restriction endonuclease subunit S [Prevotella sp.]
MDRQYKDSRIKWIGSIPESWKIYRIKYNTFLKGRIGWQGLNSNDFIDEGYCLITGTDFDNKGGINWNTCYRISKERFDEDELLHIKNGDLLMTKDGTIGKMAYIDNLPEEASLNSHLLIIRQITNLMNNKYLYWVMLSDVFVQFYNLFQSGTTMGSISQSTLGLFSTPCPPIPEQLRIANYLEEKCGEIDSLIALQEQMIEKLKAYKQSVITEAVTKGLNPNAKLVPSGIDWIGEIPARWKVAPLKSILQRRSEKNNPVKTKERLSLSIDKGVTLYAEKTTNLDRFKDDFSQYQLAYPNDIVLNSMNMIVGAVGLSNYYGCVSPVYYVVYSKSDDTDIKYYSYLLNTQRIRDVYHSLGQGIYAIERGEGRVNTCRLKVSYDDFGVLRIPVPPLSEQQTIALYLDEKCADIDRLIALKQQKIESLKDYKESVIYEAVTGKTEI